MPPMGALDWQLLQIGLGGGLYTKTDARFSSPPSLDIARDVQSEELGGLQTRFPFTAMNNAIFGGGTLANCRRLAVLNGELCVFTDVGLYSWNAQLSQWVLRGTHLACSVEETPRCATTGDQIDGDRAELAGTVVYVWSEGTQAYAAAYDKTTGSVLASPTSMGANSARPRVVALATKILLFFTQPNNLGVRAIDPANPTAGFAGAATTVNAGNVQGPYDVVRAGTQDVCVGAFARTVATSYTVFSYTSALASTTVTKARTCDGPIAVSTIPDGTQTQIVRANGTNIQGDLLTTSGFADVFTAQAVGTVTATPVNQIAAAHRSVQNGGAFRCYAFWHSGEDAASETWQSKTNWVDTANTLGTQATFVRHLGVASRAFDYAGSVYVWIAFGGATTANVTGPVRIPPLSLQNTYFLYRDDAFLVAKSIAGQGGGFAPSTGRLPGVALVSGSTGYAWCGTKRRRIELSGGTGFAAREPVDVLFMFDSNSARRSVQLGRTLYVTGGEILQYDGTRLVEVNFHVYPWILSIIDAAAGGSVAVGVYAYKSTWRYQNAQGEVDRSTTATIATVTVSGNSTSFVDIAPLTATHKTAVPPASEIWRSAVSPAIDVPFYLASSNDPAALTNPNRYMPNDPTLASLPTFNDFFSDATLTIKETNPENGAVLEHLAPPPAQIIIATDTRVFLAGVAGDPDRIWPSLLREDGQVAAWNDGLPVTVPRQGGKITALWIQDEVLYVGRESAIYALPGTGFDNTGGGQNFGPAQIVSLDVGPVSQEAQVLTPVGTLFKSSKGWYLMDRGRALRYVGGAVDAFDADTVLSMEVITSQHHVRILTNNRLIVWDYRGTVAGDAEVPAPSGAWWEWTVNDGLDAVMWQGQYVYLTSTGPKAQSAALSGLTYGMDAETSWIKFADLQGYAKARAVQILGEYRSAFLLRVRVARDYQYDGSGNVSYFDDKAWTPTPTVVGSALQVRHVLSAGNGNCEALKVRFTAVTDLTRATLLTASMSPAVPTSGTNWTSTWRATLPGEMGNAVTMTVSVLFTSSSIVVNDHFAWSPTLGQWIEDVNNIGVLLPGVAPTVAQLEAAISGGTSLAQLTAGDPSSSKTVNVVSMFVGNLVCTGALTGGAYGAPTGEALKLTGLALEVGMKRGLYNRLPAGQKQ